MAANLPPDPSGIGRPPVQLGSLVHDSCQNAYRELHQLIDSLPEKSSTERKELVLDYAQRTRHRVLRILVSVRWAMDYALKMEQSNAVVLLANQRAQSYSGAADTLFFVRNTAVGAESGAKLVGGAAEILVSGELDCMPKAISRSINIPEPLSGGESGAKKSLGQLTRHALRFCLPLPGNVRVLEWRVEKPEFASRIGVPGAWSADISFDQLDTTVALLRVYAVEVMVSSDVDASAEATHAGSKARFSMSEKQKSVLVNVCNERVRAAISDMDAPGMKYDPHQGKERDLLVGKRCTKMVEAIREFIGPEVCAPLAMEHLYHQAAEMTKGPLSNIFKMEVLKKGEPIVVSYWRHHRRRSHVVIRSAEEDGETSIDEVFERHKLPSRFISVAHEPPLSKTINDSVPPLMMNSINLERLLNHTLRSRELARLSTIQDALLDNKRQVRVRLNRSPYVSVTVSADGLQGGIEFRMDALKGSISSRYFGNAAMVMEEANHEVEDLKLLSTSAVFKNDEEEAAEIKKVVDRAVDALRVLSKARIFRSASIGASVVPPAGVSRPLRVEGPYVPVESVHPRSFASLRHRSSSSNITDTERRGIITFIGSRATSVKNVHTAILWIERIRCHFLARELRRLFRVERLLDDKAPEWTPVADKIGRYAGIGLPTSGLCVVNSYLILNADESWQVKLTTSQVIFDRQAYSTRRWGPTRFVTYNNGTLTFSYPVVTTEAVRTFLRELKCARTMATFGLRLPRKTSTYQMMLRTPRKLIFGILDPVHINATRRSAQQTQKPAGSSSHVPQLSNGMPAANANSSGTVVVASQTPGQTPNPNPTLSLFSHQFTLDIASYGRFGFRVGISSTSQRPIKTPAMTPLAKLAEELMDAAREDVGIALAGVLERSCAVGAVVERILLSRFSGQVNWISVVQVRLRFLGEGPTKGRHFELDVDLRPGNYIIILDFGRAAGTPGITVSQRSLTAPLNLQPFDSVIQK
uniref:Mediator of RNA polymerase II transcription subunit 14 n=2 Tax=Rhodosorus marinus TaxID=101924 RepID=A0A7S3E712_9RHOD|mmetsp:Transcript_11108/g.46382  ORF Transcript_11108/g.46382 Transcript_11108/m.46382 type:complete len:982 (+) Transcript_11108:386-3331(+)